MCDFFSVRFIDEFLYLFEQHKTLLNSFLPHQCADAYQASRKNYSAISVSLMSECCSLLYVILIVLTEINMTKLFFSKFSSFRKLLYHKKTFEKKSTRTTRLMQKVLKRKFFHGKQYSLGELCNAKTFTKILLHIRRL